MRGISARIYDASVRTTVDINDALLRELREQANASRRPFKVVLEEVLQRGLGGGSAPRKRRGKVQIETAPVGIKEGFQGMSMNQLYDQIEAEERRRQ